MRENYVLSQHLQILAVGAAQWTTKLDRVVWLRIG